MEQFGVMSESEWVKTISSASFSSPLTKKKIKGKENLFPLGRQAFLRSSLEFLCPFQRGQETATTATAAPPHPQPPTFNLLIQGLGQAQNWHTG